MCIFNNFCNGVMAGNRKRISICVILGLTKAELKGNLTFLYDVFNNYKYNWNNEMYKNSNHTMVLEKFGHDEVFGRSAVTDLLKLKNSSASKLLSNLVQADIIEPVSGYGKGK